MFLYVNWFCVPCFSAEWREIIRHDPAEGPRPARQEGDVNVAVDLPPVQQLNASVDSLYTELMRAGKEDEDEIARQYGNFKGACDRIDRNGDQPDEYIAQAKAFNEDLSGFPANLLGGIFGVKALDTYGR